MQEVGGADSEKLLEMAQKSHHRRVKESDSAFGSQHSNSERSCEEMSKDTPNDITDNHIASKANSTVNSIVGNSI